MKQTKIICTLGPSTDDVKTLAAMIEEGMDVARINFSHGDYESYDNTIRILKKARKAAQKEVALMMDTKGPEIRTGHIDEGEISLEKDSIIKFVGSDDFENERCTSGQIFLSYPEVYKDVEKGQVILIDDGHINAEIIDVKGKDIIARVLNDSILRSRRGVNIPGAKIGLPIISQEDKEDILYAIRQDADFLAVSFVRNSENVMEVRNFLDKNGGKDVRIISKIENQEGLENVEEIRDVSDGLMVARGDLGVETPYTAVPAAQERIIKKCLRGRKVVVTATEMLDSMKNNHTPTRAEVSDVHNAVRQGTTCVMLSAETASGKYPVEVVKTMSDIIKDSEKGFDYFGRFRKTPFLANGHVTTAVCHSATSTAYNVRSPCIVAFSESGHTAMNISAFRPKVPIIVVSPNAKVMRQSHILWGVQPILRKRDRNIEDMFRSAALIAEEFGFAEEGDSVVVVAGMPVGVSGTTNTIRVVEVGNVLVTGYPYNNGSAEGKLRICFSMNDIERLKKGDIAVFFKFDSRVEKYLDRLSAVLVASSNHDKATLEKAKALGIPVMIDTRSVLERLEDGMEVRVLAGKGVVVKK